MICCKFCRPYIRKQVASDRQCSQINVYVVCILLKTDLRSRRNCAALVWADSVPSSCFSRSGLSTGCFLLPSHPSFTFHLHYSTVWLWQPTVVTARHFMLQLLKLHGSYQNTSQRSATHRQTRKVRCTRNCNTRTFKYALADSAHGSTPKCR